MADLALITGATGFAGSHLLELLLESGVGVAAWSNPRGHRATTSDPRVLWQAVDMLDRAAVAEAIADLRPAVIYHCAGVADVGGSWSQPERPLRVNALGTHHLLEAVQSAKLGARVLVTGSALVYRQVASPIGEDAEIGPSSPYGLSKLAQELVAASATWCPVLLARAFNHAGPRQSPAYVTSSFARQIAEIEAGLNEPVLRVGNLESRRDLTDVRDTVRAYRALVDRGIPAQPYNICSGQAYRIGDLLDMLVGMARADLRVEVDQVRVRPVDNPVVLGDPSRIMRDTGWQPRIPIRQTLQDLLDYWRERVAAPQP